MTETTRVCRQCGREQDIELFKYLRGARKTDKRGREHTCKDCTTINARYRRLIKLDNPTPEQQLLIDKTETIYKVMYERNNKATIPPAAKVRLGISTAEDSTQSAIESLDNMLEALK